MMPLGPATRIYLAASATDLRKSFEGLSDLLRHRFQEDPLSGHGPSPGADRAQEQALQ